MGEPRLTEERLRTWLAGDQPSRERLCIAVLSLDAAYESVCPRRPKGGPDEARDIEAVHRSGHVAWGAVGFRNNAIDSTEDKRWVCGKFRMDMLRALTENPGLKAFCFFTNIDLTPAEQRALQEEAANKGLLQCDLYYRERIRIALDSPAGLATRFQYLSIPLSEAEQAAFFSAWGNQLEELVVSGFNFIEQRLTRIEFFHECSKPLRTLKIEVDLDGTFTPDELGHFRILLEIITLGKGDPHPTQWLGGRDAYLTRQHGDQSILLFGSRSLRWSRNPDQPVHSFAYCGPQPQPSLPAAAESLTFMMTVPQRAVSGFELGVNLDDNRVYETLGDLDEKIRDLYMTRPLFEKLHGIAVHANDYCVLRLDKTILRFQEGPPLAAWPVHLTECEVGVPWGRLSYANDPIRFNFASYTPQKLER